MTFCTRWKSRQTSLLRDRRNRGLFSPCSYSHASTQLSASSLEMKRNEHRARCKQRNESETWNPQETRRKALPSTWPRWPVQGDDELWGAEQDSVKIVLIAKASWPFCPNEHHQISVFFLVHHHFTRACQQQPPLSDPPTPSALLSVSFLVFLTSVNIVICEQATQLLFAPRLQACRTQRLMMMVNFGEG